MFGGGCIIRVREKDCQKVVNRSNEKYALPAIIVDKLLAKRVNQINDGTYQESEKILFEDYSLRWLADYAKISVKKSSYISYESIVRVHLNPRFGKQFLNRISTADIQKFVSEKITKEGLTPKSVVNFLIPLKEMFKHAVAWGYIKRDPSLYVKRPRVEMVEMDFFTPEELRIFLDHVDPKHYALFLTAVMTGMRRGELFALQWGDIDWNSDQISVRRSIYRGEFVNPFKEDRFVTMKPSINRLALIIFFDDTTPLSFISYRSIMLSSIPYLLQSSRKYRTNPM